MICVQSCAPTYPLQLLTLLPYLPSNSSIVKFAKAAGTTRLVSLLQPGPETFSLFDEVVLLAEGQLIYTGPIDDVVDYFTSLGYRQPNTMDVADFLQSVATQDGELMFSAEESPNDVHYTASEFASAFRSSGRYRKILAAQSYPLSCNWNARVMDTVDEEDPGQSVGGTRTVPDEVKRHYSNPFWTSVNLNVRRNLTLLKRDKEFLIGKCIENL